MHSSTKKIILIVLLLVVAGLIAFALYTLFFKTPELGQPSNQNTNSSQTGVFPKAQDNNQTTATNSNSTGNSLPSAGTIPKPGSATFEPTPVAKITPNTADFPSLSSSNGSLRYQNSSDGKFYRVDKTGAVTPLSDQVFYRVDKVTWATNQDKAVLEYPDGSKTIYNFETKKQVSLPKHWEDFSFSPTGSEIAAKSMGLSPENRWLVTAKDDGTGTQLIEPMGDYADQVQVNWSPSRQTVAFSKTGQALGADRQQILMIGLNGENFKSLTVEGLNFLPEWSPTGKKLLYSSDSARSDFKPELWIVDAYGDDIGSNRQSIKLNTWADKCTFADDTTLFCAVPRDLPQGAGMARDLSSGSYDDVYKVDVTTGLKTPISLGSDNYTVKSLSYDKTKNQLLFTDNNQSGIFQVKL